MLCYISFSTQILRASHQYILKKCKQNRESAAFQKQDKKLLSNISHCLLMQDTLDPNSAGSRNIMFHLSDSSALLGYVYRGTLKWMKNSL